MDGLQKAMPTGFEYFTISVADMSRIGSLMACRYSTRRLLQAVMWDASRSIWMYAPAIADGYLGDIEYMDQASLVDRGTAERVARETLDTELPSDERLVELCEEGERMGWTLGPPYEDDED